MRRLWVALTLFVSCLVAACTTTGHQFDDSTLPLLVPGQTTLHEASALFKADPVDVYRSTDGSAVARWAFKASWVPDAVYYNRELWLAFGPDGAYQRIVKSINIPRAYEFNQQSPVQPVTVNL